MGCMTTLDAGTIEEDVDSAVWEGVGIGDEVGDDEAYRGGRGEVCDCGAARTAERHDVIAG